MNKTSNIQRNISGMRSSLYNFAMMLTSNSDRAYDLVQDTTLCALQQADTIEGASNLQSIVMGLMRNIFITNYRRTAHDTTCSDTADNVYNLDLAQEAGLESPEGCLTANEVSTRMQYLTKETRTAYTLFIKGYTHDEIADRLDMDVRDVRKAVNAASQAM